MDLEDFIMFTPVITTSIALLAFSWAILFPPPADCEAEKYQKNYAEAREQCCQ